MAYGEQLPTDSASKKFIAVLADDSDSNAFVAIKGGPIESQNGEDVAPMEVSSAQLHADLATTLVAAVGAVEDDVEAMSAKLPAALSGDGNLPVVIRGPFNKYLPVVLLPMTMTVVNSSPTHLSFIWFAGFLVTSSTSGTVKIADHVSHDTLIDTMDVIDGQAVFFPSPVITGGIDITLSDCVISVLGSTAISLATETS